MKKAFLILLLAAWAASAAASTLIRDEQVRQTPSASAPVVANFAKGTQVDVVGRQGGWVQVKVQGKTGWVRLLSVRSSSGGSAGAGEELGGVVGLATKRNDNRVVAVAGLRGLNEEDLKTAHFDASQLKKLDSYVVGRQAAENFAARGKLHARSVAYLPEPAQSAAPASNDWEGRLP